jgi:chemotaxis protein MotA
MKKNKRQKILRAAVVGEPKTWDRGLLYGSALALIVLAISAFASHSFLEYVDLPSILLVFGGTIAAGLINFSVEDLVFTFKRTASVSSSTLESPKARIQYFVRLLQIVRSHGVMALEHEAVRVADPFIRRAIELAADAQPEKDLIRILETATAIGPAMALALLTTLYGAVLANLLFLPLAGKLRLRNEEETLLRSLTIEGTLSLLKSENPLLLEQRLITFLPGFSESRLAA